MECPWSSSGVHAHMDPQRSCDGASVQISRRIPPHDTGSLRRFCVPARDSGGRTSLNSAAMAATHRDVKANGVRLRVALSGPSEGSPVVLLHGLFMDHRTWDGTVAALAPEFRV